MSYVNASIFLRKYYRRRVKEITKTEKPSSLVNATNPPSQRRAKGLTRPQTPQERALTKKTQKEKLTCVPYARPWSIYELTQGHAGTSQSHEVDLVDRSQRRRRPCKVPGAKKRPSEGKELNYLVANAVKAVLTAKKHDKAKASSASGSEDDQEHFNFKTLKIGGEMTNTLHAAE